MSKGLAHAGNGFFKIRLFDVAITIGVVGSETPREFAI
jgi:hypothetical protein